MNTSESIKEIALALAKFNGEVSKIAKDANNPQFRSHYVTLDALIEATRPILQAHGLSVMQFPLSREDGEIGIQTMLLHTSGEYIESYPLFMTPTRMAKGGEHQIAKDPQAAGSTISYLRRYSYQAILNLNTGEDDDGNNASPKSNELNGSKQNLSEAQIKRLYAIATKAKVNSDKVVEQVKKKYGCMPCELTKQQYDAVCAGYEKLGASNG